MARGIECAAGMAEVVGKEVKLGLRKAALQLGGGLVEMLVKYDFAFGRAVIAGRNALLAEIAVGREPGFGIEGERDVIDLVGSDAGLAQGPLDRLVGKLVGVVDARTLGMLYPVEPPLFDGPEDDAVTEKTDG